MKLNRLLILLGLLNLLIVSCEDLITGDMTRIMIICIVLFILI